MVGGNFVKERKKKITHTRNHPSNTNTDMANKKKKVASLFLNKIATPPSNVGKSQWGGWVPPSRQTTHAHNYHYIFFS